jgi:hypothetical protein
MLLGENIVHVTHRASANLLPIRVASFGKKHLLCEIQPRAARCIFWPRDSHLLAVLLLVIDENGPKMFTILQ